MPEQPPSNGLLPCPFCGHGLIDIVHREGRAMARCQSCQTAVLHDSGVTSAHVVSTWNRRLSPIQEWERLVESVEAYLAARDDHAPPSERKRRGEAMRGCLARLRVVQRAPIEQGAQV